MGEMEDRVAKTPSKTFRQLLQANVLGIREGVNQWVPSQWHHVMGRVPWKGDMKHCFVSMRNFKA